MPQSIPPDIQGQFRVFRMELGREIPRVLRLMQKCETDLLYLARKRRLSVGAQHALAKHWREAGGGGYRFAFAGPAPTPNGDIAFVDMRPSTSEVLLNRWKNKRWEEGVCVMQFAILLKSKRAHLDAPTTSSLTSLANASAHAMCRRVQRGGGSMFEAARDLQVIYDWAALVAAEGSQFFVAPTASGHWIGEIRRLNDEGRGPVDDALARTWISADNTYDHEIEKAVSELRSIGPHGDRVRDLCLDLSVRCARQLLD